MQVAVEGREPLLPVPVDVVGQLVAGLLHGLEERTKERAVGRTALQHERAIATAELISAGEAGLHPLEVRQTVLIVPARHAGIGCPASVVERVATLEDHSVDAARPAEDLTSGVVDAAPVHVRLWL